MFSQENQAEVLKELNNIFNREALQTNISRIAIFVLLFETLKKMIINKLCIYYNNNKKCEFKRGKIVCREDDSYRKEVRALDSSDGNKIFDASIEWYKKQGVLSDEDAMAILKAKKRRNVFAHELFDSLIKGWTEEDSCLLAEILSLYQKLDSWWVYNDFSAIYPDSETVTQEDCHSVSAEILEVIKGMVLNKKE